MIYYLGPFPPDYGGVTIKNQNLFYALNKSIKIKKIDLNKIKKHNMFETIKLIVVLLFPFNKFVIGVAGKKTRKNFCKLLYYVNRYAMKKSIIFLMGGTASHDIVLDSTYSKYINEYKKVYVETMGMKKEMDEAGFTNVEVYPNGRFKPIYNNSIKFYGDKLRCVFFSLISPLKGVDNIIEAAKTLPDVIFDFYGPILKSYEIEFLNQIDTIGNIRYNGVFSGSNEEVYSQLRKYDILLFPTKYKIEGVPGILVESKIAGITAIVSNESYNSEIIRKEQGVVLNKNTAINLIEEIQKLNKDRNLLYKMKINNQSSAELYYIENYIDTIIDVLTNK